MRKFLIVIVIGFSKISLASGPLSYPTPHWNKDGILFVRSLSDKSENIFLINPENMSETQVTHMKGRAKFPKWSPSKQWLAFRYDDDSDDNGKLDKLFMLRWPDKKIEEIKGNRFVKPMAFWAPNGQKVAICGLDGISVAFLDGASSIYPAECSNPFSGAWDVDSQRFYFNRKDFGVSYLDIQTGIIKNAVTNIEFSGADFVVQDSITDWFRVKGKSKFGTLVLGTLDFTSLFEAAPEQECFVPAYSPDGKIIAYTCYETTKQEHSWFILNLNLNTANVVASGKGLHPRWSPTSKEIVFTLRSSNGFELYTYSLDTQTTKFLAQGNLID